MRLELFENFGEKLYRHLEGNERFELFNFLPFDTYCSNPNFIEFTPGKLAIFNRILPFEFDIYKKRLMFTPNSTRTLENNINLIMIYSLVDEWYIVQKDTPYFSSFYKCDSVEGVVEYLDSIGLTNRKKFESSLWEIDNLGTDYSKDIENLSIASTREFEKIFNDNNLDYHLSSKKIDIFLGDGFFINLDTPYIYTTNKRIKISSIKIIDLSDEWYQVSFLRMNDISTTIFIIAKYKCDGREGVIDLLRNKRVIK